MNSASLRLGRPLCGPSAAESASGLPIAPRQSLRSTLPQPVKHRPTASQVQKRLAVSRIERQPTEERLLLGPGQYAVAPSQPLRGGEFDGIISVGFDRVHDDPTACVDRVQHAGRKGKPSFREALKRRDRTLAPMIDPPLDAQQRRDLGRGFSDAPSRPGAAPCNVERAPHARAGRFHCRTLCRTNDGAGPWDPSPRWDAQRPRAPASSSRKRRHKRSRASTQ